VVTGGHHGQRDQGVHVFDDVHPRHHPPRLMVVVAHPDDETYGCGSLLLAAVAAG
jgi:LmbE family N-acetylglucosaminyl deacetylase